MTIDLDLLFQGQIQFLPITLKLLVLETVLFQGQTDNRSKVYVILVLGAGESIIHSFILVDIETITIIDMLNNVRHSSKYLP